MGLTDNLKASGFKITPNEDGLFKPLVGTYEGTITVLRPDMDLKNGNAKYYQLEITPSAVIDGDEYGPKFTFKKRYYVEGEKADANFQKLVKDLFTCGLELDMSSDSAFEADFEKAIGVKAYVRAWAWTPEGKDPQQSFVIQQAKVADKKRKETALPF